jgi:hypothetical protein
VRSILLSLSLLLFSSTSCCCCCYFYCYCCCEVDAFLVPSLKSPPPVVPGPSLKERPNASVHPPESTYHETTNIQIGKLLALAESAGECIPMGSSLRWSVKSNNNKKREEELVNKARNGSNSKRRQLMAALPHDHEALFPAIFAPVSLTCTRQAYR